jgi:hypothetical protein
MNKRLPVSVAILLAIIAATVCGYLAITNPRFLNDIRLMDTYFGADIPKRFLVLIDRNSTSADTYKHPLFPLLHVPVQIAHNAFHLDYPTAIAVVLAGNAALWTILTFLLCYHITHKVLDGFIYTMFALTTASSLFWLPTTETYAFGSTSILIPLVVAIMPSFSFNAIAHAIAFFVTSAITITNVIVAIVAQVAMIKWRGLIIASLSGAILLLSASLLQRSLFPNSQFFLNPNSTKRDFTKFAGSKPIVNYMNEFILSPLTPARIYYGMIPKHNARVDRLPRISTMRLGAKIPYRIISASPVVVHRTLYSLWIALLLSGVLSAILSRRDLPILPILLASVLGQFVLHAMYGYENETFIYSLHWTPLLVMISATNSRHKWRYVALAFAVVLTVGCITCNFKALSAMREVLMSVNLEALNSR